MPFWKGKGKHILFFDKSGKTRIYYEIPDSDGKVKIGGVTYSLNSTDHSLSDYTGGKGTIHFLDGEPLYIIVQGCPSNVLVRQRNYDFDIGKLNKVIDDIDKLNEVKDDVRANSYLVSLAKQSFKLAGGYSYLMPARRIVKEILKIAQAYTSGSLEGKEDDYQILLKFKTQFLKLERLLEKRDRTLINFDDFFTVNDLSKAFNNEFSNALALRNIEQERMKNGINKYAKLGIGIAIAVVGLVVFLLFKQSGHIEEMQASIVSINSNMSEIKTDLDSYNLVKDLNVSGNPVPSNNSNSSGS